MLVAPSALAPACVSPPSATVHGHGRDGHVRGSCEPHSLLLGGRSHPTPVPDHSPCVEAASALPARARREGTAAGAPCESLRRSLAHALLGAAANTLPLIVSGMYAGVFTGLVSRPVKRDFQQSRNLRGCVLPKSRNRLPCCAVSITTSLRRLPFFSLSRCFFPPSPSSPYVDSSSFLLTLNIQTAKKKEVRSVSVGALAASGSEPVGLKWPWS